MIENYIKSTVSDFKTALNIYVYDYLIKSKLSTTASTFLSECNLPSELANIVNSSTEVFLQDWFEIFYSVSRSIGKGSLSDPKIRNFLASLARLPQSEQSPTFCHNSFPQNTTTPSSTPSYHNMDVSGKPLQPSDSVANLKQELIQNKHMYLNNGLEKSSPPLKKNKLIKTPKSSTAVTKSLNRISAPTSISLPPTTISLSSWAGVETSQESVSISAQNTIVTGASLSSQNVAEMGVSISSHPLPHIATSNNETSQLSGAKAIYAPQQNFLPNEAKQDKQIPFSSVGVPNKALGLTPMPIQNQLNSNQRFVAEQHAYLRNERKRSNMQRANSLQLYNASIGQRSLLTNGMPLDNSGMTFSNPNAPSMGHLQAFNMITKDMSFNNAAIPVNPFGNYVNDMQGWNSSALMAQPNMLSSGMPSGVPMPINTGMPNPELFDQFINNTMLMREADPNQVSIPPGEDPFSAYNNMLFFDQFPQ